MAEAVGTGNASRIGHGVDSMYEEKQDRVFSPMAEENVPVGVLFTSNQEVLHPGGPSHPVSLYLARQVPIVLGTDDPGVGRTDLAEQYVILAYEHPEVSYEQVRVIANEQYPAQFPIRGRERKVAKSASG